MEPSHIRLTVEAEGYPMWSVVVSIEPGRTIAEALDAAVSQCRTIIERDAIHNYEQAREVSKLRAKLGQLLELPEKP